MKERKIIQKETKCHSYPTLFLTIGIVPGIEKSLHPGEGNREWFTGVISELVFKRPFNSQWLPDTILQSDAKS